MLHPRTIRHLLVPVPCKSTKDSVIVRFEKSLYDLIRGMRNHKGKEKEYIQSSLSECRKEIRSQDMDLKATAVLKLTYLEMFGYDMSWASFNVLEVMSSQKFYQKRIGYLGAVQSFRPDTEVLMLVENLLKKDLGSPQITTISLPLVAVPHVMSPSMANSLLSDILPRLTHSNPIIRKKTVVALYRLALVYPETLRPAWPKIKERLLDENEDSSVTAAIVNVVCELGWRRPQDFLPLAPRLFDLLVEGSNNWMAIKIIKLFATLTPLEPRLVKKLLPPLTTLIKSTPAMSLLYECINGIIQGGILESAQGTTEGDDVARLCVGKLRGMLSTEEDPNLKYVALLAFNKIVQSHPYLVSFHEDVIMSCIDDPDVSIRLRALDLVAGMVNAENLTSLVDKLLLQLRNSPLPSFADDPDNDRSRSAPIAPEVDSDDEEATRAIRPDRRNSKALPPLPDDYRTTVIQMILDMCSRDTYSNVGDFDWYIGVLIQLVKHVPAQSSDLAKSELRESSSSDVELLSDDMALNIGCELRNVAVRVKSSRQDATRAAESLVSIERREQLFPSSGNGGQGVLAPVVWIVGEFASFLSDSEATLTSLVHSSTSQLPARTLSAYLQAIIKIFVHVTGDEQQAWSTERKSHVLLVCAKMVHFYESLTSHPNIEVQERAVEYLELARLASEAASSHESGAAYELSQPPRLLTQALPALFSGMELNPVARDAQRKVPVPDGLDLETPINERLPELLQVFELESEEGADEEFRYYYHERPQIRAAAEPAANRLAVAEPEISYQQSSVDYLDPEEQARRREERRERYRDDPFYIPSAENFETSRDTVLRTSNGEELDVDSIPIMELDLGGADHAQLPRAAPSGQSKPKAVRNLEILADETVGDGGAGSNDSTRFNPSRILADRDKGKRSLLQVDSSGLGSFTLEGESSRGSQNQLDIERREAEEAEMEAAIKEVERLRREMQRASERLEAKQEGTVVKKKKKKKRVADVADDDPVENQGETDPVEGGVEVEKKKKRKKKEKTESKDEGAGEAATAEPSIPTTTKRKKKKRQVVFEEEDVAAAPDTEP